MTNTDKNYNNKIIKFKFRWVTSVRTRINNNTEFN